MGEVANSGRPLLAEPAAEELEQQKTCRTLGCFGDFRALINNTAVFEGVAGPFGGAPEAQHALGAQGGPAGAWLADAEMDAFDDDEITPGKNPSCIKYAPNERVRCFCRQQNKRLFKAHGLMGAAKILLMGTDPAVGTACAPFAWAQVRGTLTAL